MITFSAYEHMECQPKEYQTKNGTTDHLSGSAEARTLHKNEYLFIRFAEEYLKTEPDPAKNIYEFLCEVPQYELAAFFSDTGNTFPPSPLQRMSWLASKLPDDHPAKRDWEQIDCLSEYARNKAWSNAIGLVRNK